MNSNIIHYEECEDCWKKVDIMKMIVKETSDGNCIYCPECIKKQKELNDEIKRIYNVDFNNITNEY